MWNEELHNLFIGSADYLKGCMMNSNYVQLHTLKKQGKYCKVFNIDNSLIVNLKSVVWFSIHVE